MANKVAVLSARSNDLATNAVLRNTYMLLGMTLVFSGCTAALAMTSNAAPVGFITLLVGMFGLQMLTMSTRNSGWGLVSIFAFTGFMGYVLGPILNLYIAGFSNGTEIVLTSLGSTGIIFLALSSYVLTTRKDFSFMGGFLFAGMMVAFLAGIAGLIFHMPLMHLIVSGAFALLSSGMILFQTSAIIHGGERNYIMATISLYMALFNLFLSLLRLFAAFAGGNRD